MMTNRMACEANDIFAAATAFHGQLHTTFNCEPENSDYLMPYMNIWGTEDVYVPGISGQDSYGWYYTTVNQVQDTFAQHNGCDMTDGMTNVTTISDGILGWSCKDYNNNCTYGISGTRLCQWDGNHSYPIANGRNFGLDAAWEFMSQFDLHSNYIGDSSSSEDSDSSSSENNSTDHDSSSESNNSGSNSGSNSNSGSGSGSGSGSDSSENNSTDSGEINSTEEDSNGDSNASVEWNLFGSLCIVVVSLCLLQFSMTI